MGKKRRGWRLSSGIPILRKTCCLFYKKKKKHLSSLTNKV